MIAFPVRPGEGVAASSLSPCDLSGMASSEDTSLLDPYRPELHYMRGPGDQRVGRKPEVVHETGRQTKP